MAYYHCQKCDEEGTDENTILELDVTRPDSHAPMRTIFVCVECLDEQLQPLTAMGDTLTVSRQTYQGFPAVAVDELVTYRLSRLH